MSKSEKKWYVVWSGREPGIYESWDECKRQVIGQKGARYKSFKGISRAEANSILLGGAPKVTRPRKKVSADTSEVLSPIDPDAIAVDAACSGNPGVMEYRGVLIETGDVIFHSQKYTKGTNNIGEFLAIVHALALMEQRRYIVPIYSDSRTAISWVKNKAVKTTLARDAKTDLLWQHIDRALAWLKTHDLSPYTILKWDTETRGEIPADFGRK
ncbi:ribonuclease H family protein [Porphyromonas sp.]|uniref:ribonuclease H family protein n=1 Tax=Porphyromonas sp. TaxID=1924944 RepID=UPI0026DCFCAF|nr:ribonuclease H family protein [Porphyromonas sp.]MDO4771491.1 ribonuclease H family protein [Porphyromonas sp.]